MTKDYKRQPKRLESNVASTLPQTTVGENSLSVTRDVVVSITNNLGSKLGP